MRFADLCSLKNSWHLCARGKTYTVSIFFVISLHVVILGNKCLLNGDLTFLFILFSFVQTRSACKDEMLSSFPSFFMTSAVVSFRRFSVITQLPENTYTRNTHGQALAGREQARTQAHMHTSAYTFTLIITIVISAHFFSKPFSQHEN